MTPPHVFIRDVLPAADRTTSALPTSAPRSLPLATLAVALAATVPIGTALRSEVTVLTTAPVLRPDSAVAVAVLAGGLLVALWYAATGLAVLLSLALHRDLGVLRWGAPVARRLAAGAGLGLLALAPAQAQTPDDLSWGTVAVLEPAALAPQLPAPSAGPLPTAGVTPSPAFTPTPAPTPTAGPKAETEAEAAAATHVVVAGDCLWTIAAADLPAPSNAAIAERVGDWIEANPGLASHPDLIHPGDVLVAPGADR